MSELSGQREPVGAQAELARPQTAPVPQAELSPPQTELSPPQAAPAARAASSPDEESRQESPPPGLTAASLEALLFVAERPLSPREIARLAGVEAAHVEACLAELDGALMERGIRLVRSDDRVELATALEAGALVARYVGADGLRLSPAALETLAIVAYRQPVTRAAVERIRGVDSDYVLRGLLHRRLIVEQGRAGSPGRPFLYGTGFDFLERFGLTSLDELPPLDPDVAGRLADEDADSGVELDPVGEATGTARAEGDG